MQQVQNKKNAHRVRRGKANNHCYGLETMPPVPRKTYDKHKIKAPLRTRMEFDKVDVAF